MPYSICFNVRSKTLNLGLMIFLTLFSFAFSLQLRNEVNSISNVSEHKFSELIPKIEDSMGKNQIEFLKLIQASLKKIQYPTPQEHISSFYNLLGESKENITKNFKESFPFCQDDSGSTDDECINEMNNTNSKIAYYTIYKNIIHKEKNIYRKQKNELSKLNIMTLKEKVLNNVTLNHDTNQMYMNIAKDLYFRYDIIDTLNVFQFENLTSSSDVISKNEILNKALKLNDEDYVLNRNAYGQMLFDKISWYIYSFSTRKNNLIKEGEELLNKFKAADDETTMEILGIEELIKVRKKTSESLKIELNSELNKKYTCEGTIELNKQCKEVSKIYDNAMTTLEIHTKYLEELNSILDK